MTKKMIYGWTAQVGYQGVMSSDRIWLICWLCWYVKLPTHEHSVTSHSKCQLFLIVQMNKKIAPNGVFFKSQNPRNLGNLCSTDYLICYNSATFSFQYGIESKKHQDWASYDKKIGLWLHSSGRLSRGNVIWSDVAYLLIMSVGQSESTFILYSRV